METLTRNHLQCNHLQCTSHDSRPILEVEFALHCGPDDRIDHETDEMHESNQTIQNDRAGVTWPS
jgi:hypothetical protein